MSAHSMHDWPIAFLVIQFALSILVYFGARVARPRQSEDLETFRIDPWVAWTVTAASLVISIIIAIAMLRANPVAPDDALPGLLMTELFFLLFAAYGCYCVSMRIEVDKSSIRVRSFLGTRSADFQNIGSVKVKSNGRWRTLDVIDKRGKRILYVTSCFLTDHAYLVNLIAQGAKRAPQAPLISAGIDD